MNEQIKEKLYDIYLENLKDSLLIDKQFHVDVCILEDSVLYSLTSSLFCEQPERFYYYDTPPEWSELCLSCSYWTLYSCDKEGKEKAHYNEAEEIILRAINEITK